ncbi:pantoate--beta-alanine ligase [Magnetococcales bacterium HHB-1]
MEILTDLNALHDWKKRTSKDSRGFVPTMGALHQGHLALLARAKAENKRAVCSIFVNPSQFGPHEDFSSYPRPVEADQKKLREAGCDALFYPTPELIYPENFQTTVAVEAVSKPLCGEKRPGHFQGVATVVTILLNLIQPNRAYFGLKDYQQFILIKQMAADLHLPGEIIGVKTVREKDGLALSSRNRYLDTLQRERAVALSLALKEAKAAFSAGERSPKVLEAIALKRLKISGIEKIDYVSLRDGRTLTPVDHAKTSSVMLIAAYVGKARLIDNLSFG